MALQDAVVQQVAGGLPLPRPRRAACCRGAWAALWAEGILAGGAGERNPLRFYPGVGVVCPKEDCCSELLEQGIQAWKASRLFCCSSNFEAIVPTASPKTPWTLTGASSSGAFSLSVFFKHFSKLGGVRLRSGSEVTL